MLSYRKKIGLELKGNGKLWEKVFSKIFSREKLEETKYSSIPGMLNSWV